MRALRDPRVLGELPQQLGLLILEEGLI